MAVEATRVPWSTGGSRGIGRGIVNELAALGLSVVVNYRSDSIAAEAACREAEQARMPPTRAIAVQADLVDLEQGRRLIDRTLDCLGRFDVWVNNAGIAPENRRDLLETTPESWDKVLGVNLRAPFFLTQAVSRSMIEQVAASLIADRDHLYHLRIKCLRQRQPRRGQAWKAGLSMVAQLLRRGWLNRGSWSTRSDRV